MDWGIILGVSLGLLAIGLIVIVAGLILMVWDFIEGTLARWRTTLINIAKR